MRAPIEQLIARWRKHARWESEQTGDYAIGNEHAHDRCADDLEALLAALPPESAQTCSTCRHLTPFELAPELNTCPVVNIRIHTESATIFGCNQHEPKELPGSMVVVEYPNKASAPVHDRALRIHPSSPEQSDAAAPAPEPSGHPRYMEADALIADITTLCNHGCDEEAKQRLLSVMARAPEPSGWQPISTCPKDDTRFVALWDNGSEARVRWSYEVVRWRDIKDLTGFEGRAWWCAMDIFPPPPSASAAQEPEPTKNTKNTKTI